MRTSRAIYHFLALCMVSAPLAAEDALPGVSMPTYTAVYRVEYKGRKAGKSSVELTYDDVSKAYRYTSSIALEGLYKLAAPDGSAWSEFRLGADGLVLLRSWIDGVKGAADTLVEFDWDHGLARSDAFGSVRVASGTLDAGTMPVALMNSLLHAQTAGSHTVLNGGETKTYQFAQTAEETLNTPLGALSTTVVEEQQPESRRTTVLWMAPELCFLPVRITQQVDDHTETSLVLETAEVLRRPQTCAG